MSTHSRSSLRRVGALATIPAVLLLSACGLKQDYSISKDETVNLTYTMTDDSGSGYLTESSCSADSSDTSSVPAGAHVTYKYSQSSSGDDVCTVTATNMPLSEFDGSDSSVPKITHEGRTFVFDQKVSSSDVSDIESYGGDVDATVNVTFPGKVKSVSGNGTKSGNTATWNDVLREKENLHAVGADGSTNVLLWVLIGLLALILIAGAVVAVILVNRGKKKGATPADYVPSQPGQPAAYGQPTPASQGASAYGQPGAAGYSGQPNQPAQTSGGAYAQPSQTGGSPYGQAPTGQTGNQQGSTGTGDERFRPNTQG